ncbi:MAG: sigma-70 family RNA polymerase sigma factor [Acidobacteria bacterium]|nr:sigma-70 family RNA polymerase sigma factor [Acidobacteriota bacterium]
MSAILSKSKNKLSLVKTDQHKTLTNLELVKLCTTTDNEYLWDEFYKRFSKYIKLYVRKAWKIRSSSTNVDSPNVKEILRDLAQDVYVKLLESNRQALRSFSGENEISFLAYLAKISTNTVSEYFRRQLAEKRRGQEMSVEELLDDELCELLGSRALTYDYLSINGEDLCFNQIASQQVSKLIEDSLTGSNSKRDFLVFKLAIVEGLTSRQIVETEKLEIKSTSIESIVRRVKDKVRIALKVKPTNKNSFQQAA